MSPPGEITVVVLDTCVLAPMPLCDTLLRLAEDPTFYVPKWSGDIMRELRSTLLRMGYTLEQVNRRLTAMGAAFEDAGVVGYMPLIPALRNNPKGRNVLAAAVHAGAHAILTTNVRHFPPASLKPYEIHLLTPGDFLLQCHHLDPRAFAGKLAEQALARGVSISALLDRLANWASEAVRLIAKR